MSIEIGILIAIASFAISYFSFYRNRDKDMRGDAEESAVIRTKLDNISAGIDSIRIDIKSNERRVTELTERVIRMEESAKQAHLRINTLEGRSHEH